MKKILLYFALACAGYTGYSQEMWVTTSDGVQLYVNVKGTGSPVLYLHGGPGSGSYWAEKFYGETIEKHFTMIYLDQRGVGRSSSPKDDNYSMKRMVRDFEEVRKHLGYDNWLTLGHSFGGILQMGYVEEYPEAHTGMIMVNCTLNIKESFCESWSPKAAEFLNISHLPSCANDTIPLMDRMESHIYQLKEKDLFWKMAYQDQKYDTIMNATYLEFPEWNSSFGNVALSYEDYWKDYKPATAHINLPVLFFYGTKDWMVGPGHFKGMQFPNIKLWENEGGHIPFLENKEDLELAILSFIRDYNL